MKNEIENWIKEINRTETIPGNITALNFGLFESENNYILYLIGAQNYDEADDDWATEVDYEPKDKYLKLSNSKDKDWNEILNDVINVINEVLNSEGFQNSIIGKVKNITIGFDDGDLAKIK